MSQPLVVDLPHSLGAAEARRRIDRNIGKLTSHLPGGGNVDSRWEGDRLHLQVAAMGQQVTSKIDVQERVVRLEVTLPPGLSFFGGMIESVIRRQGEAMLEDKSSKA